MDNEMMSESHDSMIKRLEPFGVTPKVANSDHKLTPWHKMKEKTPRRPKRRCKGLNDSEAMRRSTPVKC